MRLLICDILLITVFATAGLTQTNTQSKTFTNNDIIDMTRAGVPESTILASIEASAAQFDVSTSGLIALHAAGVTEAVLNEMIHSHSQARSKAGPGFGVATGTFPVREALGKTVHFSAWIKTENVKDGYAGLWWRVDGKDKGEVLAFDNSQTRIIDGSPADENGVIRGATATTGWTEYGFDLPVSNGARNINFGLLFTGTGTAWFDALAIKLDGSPFNSQMFDLDFESTTPKGFYTGGDGYEVRLDNSTAWSV